MSKKPIFIVKAGTVPTNEFKSACEVIAKELRCELIQETYLANPNSIIKNL